MNNWGTTYRVVAAYLCCVLASANSWSQETTPTEELETLKLRVTELEASVNTNERAAREVIENIFRRTRGLDAASKLNDYVLFGGNLEVLAGWSEDFAGVAESDIILNSAEIDFEVQVNEWSLGFMNFTFDDGADILFPSSNVGNFETGVDRITIDEAYIVIGDPAKFPPFLRIGRIVVPFGISTGDPVADSLTIEDPLTIEVFETKEDVILLGFETLSGCNAGVYVFNGDTNEFGGEDHIQQFGATAGYFRIEYGWAFEVDVDYISSVFDSDFLTFFFMDGLEIDYVPGMAAALKSSYGPVSVVAEWNGALDRAQFTQDGTAFDIRPAAWQIQLAYQFHWDPSMESIGLQGKYVAVDYSQSEDLAGFVPEERFLAALGWWFLPGMRLQLEYAHIVDYSVAVGGTGRTANGFFTQVTYDW